MSSSNAGCQQRHGSKISLEASDGSLITYEQLTSGEDGTPTNRDVLAKIKRDSTGRPQFHSSTWPP